MYEVSNTLETRCCPMCVTIPNFFALGQTVWA